MKKKAIHKRRGGHIDIGFLKKYSNLVFLAYL